jgi:UDP-N-acetyl-D-galactosamine dehydrogenase
VVDIIRELESFSVEVEVVDPHAKSHEIHEEYGFELVNKPTAGSYDAVILAVSHKEYLNLDEAYFKSLMKEGTGVFVDLKGLYRDSIQELEYWSL